MIDYIEGNEIRAALEDSYRVYLCGDLKMPQALRHIKDNQNEIGISQYDQFQADVPHFHSNATEYIYILDGETKILVLGEDQEYCLAAGSIFVFSPGTEYASKHSAGTRVLFFKSPGGNDKVTIEPSQEVQDWLSSWEN